MKKTFLAILTTSLLLTTGCQSNKTKIDSEQLKDYYSIYAHYENKQLPVSSEKIEKLEYTFKGIREIGNYINYKTIGNKFLYIEYVNTPNHYFNLQLYEKVKNDDVDVYIKSAETALEGVYKVGITVYSLDKTFRDNEKVIASQPYLVINPKFENTELKELEKYSSKYQQDMYTLLYFTITLNLKNIPEEEREAIVSSSKLLEASEKQFKMDGMLHVLPEYEEQ